MLGEVDLRSDLPSVHPNRFRLPSSFPRQRWSHLSSSYASPVVESAGSSHQANSRRYETALDESARAYRTTALRQLNGNPRPLSRRPQQANPAIGRSSTLASQPVLVRAYSGDSDDTTKTSKMPSRRSFPFASSSRTREHRPQLPSEEDFGIDAILRAIDPNIRNTLDLIAEICGRSKLSLANEYASHIAPLGEIRAPPGGLLTVEEASPGREHQTEDDVVIFDDDNSLLDGHDSSPFTHYRYLENIRQNTGAHAAFQPMPFSSRDGNTQLNPVANPDVPEADIESKPTTKEYTTKSKSSGQALLRKSAAHDKRHSIATPAVVSEVHLDARADRHLPADSRLPSGDQDQAPSNHLDEESSAVLSVGVQALFGWLKRLSHNDPSQPQLSAEMRLRAMLGQNDRVTTDMACQSASN